MIAAVDGDAAAPDLPADAAGPVLPPTAAPTPVLALRLQAHRARLMRSLETTTNIGCGLLGLLAGYMIFWLVSMIFGVGMLMLSELTSGWLSEDAAMIFGGLAGVAATYAGLYGLRVLLRLVVRGIFRNYYREATRWLYHTDLLSLFVDENQTAQIVDLVEDTLGLRWISPPKPKKLEDLLEFSACYFAAYKRLLYGPGRLDAGSVFLGSLMWYTGQRQCVGLGCCCCIFPYSGWLTLPVWLFTGISYINRLAVEACCLDYLLDSPRDPSDADKPGYVAASHSVGEAAPSPTPPGHQG